MSQISWNCKCHSKPNYHGHGQLPDTSQARQDNWNAVGGGCKSVGLFSTMDERESEYRFF